MRRPVFLFPLFVVSLLLSLSVGAVEAETSSRVDRVILYPDMAEVTRVAEVAGTEGEVVLSGLTADLLPETVSAKVIRGAARIVGISVEDVFRPDPAEGRVRELSRLLEGLTDGKHAVEGERKTFSLARAEQKANVAWRAIPRVADGAFLSADGVNEGGLPILAAPATLFVDDAYVGAVAVGSSRK